MFDLEPGPFDLGDFPLPKPVTGDGKFEAMAADYLDARSGGAGQIAGMQQHLTSGDAPDLENDYQRTIAGAEDATANELGAGDGSQAGPINDAGDSVNASLG